MNTKKLKVILASLMVVFAVGCDKKKNDNNHVIRKTGSPSQALYQQSQVDTVAQNYGLKIGWQQTQTADVSSGLVSLTHTYFINQSTFTFQHNIYSNVVNCAEVSQNNYDATIMQSSGNSAAAVGFIPCRSGNDLYVGLSFFAWDNVNGLVGQHLVLLNITQGLFINDFKEFNYSSSISNLANWVSSQFNN